MPSIVNLEQIILPINLPSLALDLLHESDAAQTIRTIGVCWDYHMSAEKPSPKSSFLLQSIRDLTVFNSFPNLREFHITRIPYARGRVLVHRGDRGIKDLIDFLDRYEHSIYSSGISIGMTLSNGQVLKSSAELKELYG
jgi:hypothetical protein